MYVLEMFHSCVTSGTVNIVMFLMLAVVYLWLFETISSAGISSSCYICLYLFDSFLWIPKIQ